MSPIARKLRDFGNVILGNHKGSTFENKECRQAEKERSVQWYKSIKTLCDGVLAPLLDKSASPGHITKSKKEAIELLDELELLLSNYKAAYYGRFNQLKNQINQGFLGSYHSSHLSKLILEDFIGVGDPLVFQRTLQTLFTYYQFIPDFHFKEISTELNETFKVYAKKKRLVGYD